MNARNKGARWRTGAGTTDLGSGNKSHLDYKVSPAFGESLPCTCHERRPCGVCTAWHEHYRHTQAAVKALEAIAPRPALRLLKGERRP
jgi:hypothetical protein